MKSRKRTKSPGTGHRRKVTGSVKKSAAVILQNRGSAEVEALYSLGREYMKEGDLVKATEIFADVLRKKNDHIPTIENMALASQQLKRFDAAEMFFKALLEIDPRYTRAYGYLGKFYMAQKRADEALACLHKGLELAPDDGEILGGLAVAYYKTGREDKAEDYYRQAYENEKNVNNLASWINATHKVKDQNDYAFRELKKYAGDIGKVPAFSRPFVYSSLAKAYEQMKDWDQAFESSMKACALIRQKISFNIQGNAIAFQLLKQYFSEEFVKQADFESNASDKPVFIVGMPRSGSTLLEQMLDSHPAVCGVGETDHLTGLITRKLAMPDQENGAAWPFKPKVKRDEEYDLKQMADDYLSFLESHSPAAKRFVDKELSHFRWIGLIHLAFPNAKIIHCKRHPLDCCISCFQHLFKNNAQEYSYNLAELGLYYRLYEDLMAHWHAVLPGKILDVQYEDVINDTENQLRRVLDFAGLPWDGNCLNYHENKRFIHTSSSGQVNKPIYKSAMNKWKRYERFLPPLVKALGPGAPEEALYLLENG